MEIKAGTSLAAMQKGKAVQKISNEDAISLLGLDDLYVQQPASSLSGKFAQVSESGGVEWVELPSLSELTGTVPISKGGTGATTAAGALKALTGLSTTAGLPYYNSNGTMSLATDANIRGVLTGGTSGQFLKRGSSSAEWVDLTASVIGAFGAYKWAQNSTSTTSFIVDTIITASANAYGIISLITYSRDETPSLCNISFTYPASDAGTAFLRVDVSGVYGDVPTVVKAFKAADGKVGVFVQFATAKRRIMAKAMTANPSDNLTRSITVTESVPIDATLVTAATVTNRNLSQLDISTSNPVANGTPFAGVTGKVADAGHVHPISTFTELGINDTSIRGVLTGGTSGQFLKRGSSSAEWASLAISNISNLQATLNGKQASITSSNGQIIVNDSGTVKGANTIASSKVSGLGTLAAKNNITPSDFADPGSAGKVLATQAASNGDFEAVWKTLAVTDISGLQTALSGKQDSITSNDGQIIVNDNGTIKGVNEIPYTSVDGLGALATLDTATYNKITPAGTVGQVLITRASGSNRATQWDTLDANDVQALSGAETPTAGSLAEQLANLADAEHNHNEVITITNAAGTVQTAAAQQLASIFGSTSGGINSYTSVKKVTLQLAGIASTTSITLPAVADIGAVVEILYVGSGTPASVGYTVKGGVNNEIYIAADNTTANVSDGVECFAGVKEVFTHVSETRWVCTHEALLTTISSGGGTTGGGTASVSRTIVKLEAAPTAANKNFDVTYGTGDTYVYIYIRGTHDDDYNLILPANPTDCQIVKVAYLNPANNNSYLYDPLAIIVKPATDSQHIYAPQFTTSTDGKVASITLHKEGYWGNGPSLPFYNTVELIYNSADSSWYTMPFGATLTYE